MKKLSIKKTQTLFVCGVLAFPLILFAIFYVYVNINSVAMAFQEVNYDFTTSFVGLKNFESFIKMISSNGGVLNIGLKNSIKIYIINLLICMPLYIIFSYILYRKMYGHSIIRAIVMVPQIISSMIIALLFKKICDEAIPAIALTVFKYENFPHLLSNPEYSFSTVMFYNIWVSFGTSLIVYSNAIDGLDPEIIESAHIDGIDNFILELWYIILPLIFPTLETFIVVGFANFFADDAGLVTFYGSGARTESYTIGYYYTRELMIQNEKGFNELAAGGLMMSLIIAPLAFLLKRLLDKACTEV